MEKSGKKSSYKIKEQRGTSGSDMRMKVDFTEKMIIEQKSHESGLEMSHGGAYGTAFQTDGVTEEKADASIQAKF